MDDKHVREEIQSRYGQDEARYRVLEMGQLVIGWADERKKKRVEEGGWGSYMPRMHSENPSRTVPSHPSSAKGSIHDWGEGGCKVQGGPGTCGGEDDTGVGRK